MLLTWLGLLGLFAQAQTAYVQWQPCPNAEADLADKLLGFVPQTLNVALSPSHDDGGSKPGGSTLMDFRIGAGIGEGECDPFVKGLGPVEVGLQMLGRSDTFDARVTNVTCAAVRSPYRSPLEIEANLDIGTLPPLSTFYLTFNVKSRPRTGDTLKEGCLMAAVTPAITPTTDHGLRYGPLALFAFVLIVSVLRTLFEAGPDLDHEDDEEESADMRSSSVQPARALLPGLGDLLHYLQFIFLSASLSLRYPGFFQPITSYLNWFSLFSSEGPVGHSTRYRGINDGIYERNGTYGGTLGLELMTQIVGAPHTIDVWINMVILISLLSSGIAGLVVLTGVVNRRLHLWNPEPNKCGVQNVKFIAGQVFRAVFSYFLLPLISLSTYQFDFATLLPVYHTAMAGVLLVLIAFAFAWLIRQIPTRNLGVLVFDNSKGYSRVHNPANGRTTAQASFVLILFVLNFIRGAVIGGLQISSVGQIAILLGCEVVFMASIYGFNAYHLFSVGVGCAMARVVVLALMVVFLPGIVSFQVRDSIGYVILTLHAFVIVFAFLIPTIFFVGRLGLQRCRAERPNVCPSSVPPLFYFFFYFRCLSPVAEHFSNIAPSNYLGLQPPPAPPPRNLPRERLCPRRK